MANWRPLSPNENPEIQPSEMIRQAWTPVGPGSSGAGHGIVVYEQTDEPTEAVVGDVWIVP